MANKVYVVDLTEEEQASLLDLIKGGKHLARKLNRARILLHANDGKTDKEIAEAVHTSAPTVQRTRQRFVEGNLKRALNEDPRLGASTKLDEKGETVLIALARSEPPDGRKCWTLGWLGPL